jgi:hypothetical protein
MDKATFLDNLERGRAQWDALLAQVDKARMAAPGVADEWSLKDVIAHATWHEREMVGVIEARALVGSELWALPTDERNAVIFDENRDRPLNDVLAEAEQVYQQLVAGVQTLSDEDLVDPGRFDEMPAAWTPWQIIADNSYEHYLQHIPAVQAWLAKQSTSES